MTSTWSGWRRSRREVCGDFETDLVGFNRKGDHVHLRVNLPPKTAPFRLVNSLKGVSSLRMRAEFPDLARHYRRANKLWSTPSSAGAPARALVALAADSAASATLRAPP